MEEESKEVGASLKSIPWTRFLAAAVGQRFIVPYYHMVADETRSHVENLYPFKTPKQFQQDLEFLLAEFDPINLENLLRIVSGEVTHKRPVFHLTFDDGFREMYDIALPILKRMGVPATFFVNPEFIDNKAVCYQQKISLLMGRFLRDETISRMPVSEGELFSMPFEESDLLDRWSEAVGISFDDFLRREKPYLTSEQLKRMVDDGYSIGGHSLDHRRYSEIPPEEQIRQSVESVAWLRKQLDLSYGIFAFPFGEKGVNRDTIHAIHDAGISLIFGTGNFKKGIAPWHIQRVSLEKPVKPASSILRERLLKKAFRQIFPAS